MGYILNYFKCRRKLVEKDCTSLLLKILLIEKAIEGKLEIMNKSLALASILIPGSLLTATTQEAMASTPSVINIWEAEDFAGNDHAFTFQGFVASGSDPSVVGQLGKGANDKNKEIGFSCNETNNKNKSRSELILT